MTASAKTIRQWLGDASDSGANFLIVGCDKDPEGAEQDPGCCFPVRVWAKTSDDVHVAMHRAMVDQGRIQEVYDLRADLDAQMRLRRAWFPPGGNGIVAKDPLPEPPTREQILKAEMQPNERSVVQRPAESVTGSRRIMTTTPRQRPKPKPVDHEAPTTQLEAELEKGVGGLGGRLARAVDEDKDEDKEKK